MGGTNEGEVDEVEVDQIKLTRCPDLLRCCIQNTPSPASQPLEGQLSLSFCVPAPPLVWEPRSRLSLGRVWGRQNDIGLIQICILGRPLPYYCYSNPNHASTNSAFMRKSYIFCKDPAIWFAYRQEFPTNERRVL